MPESYSTNISAQTDTEFLDAARYCLTFLQITPSVEALLVLEIIARCKPNYPKFMFVALAQPQNQSQPAQHESRHHCQCSVGSYW